MVQILNAADTEKGLDTKTLINALDEAFANAIRAPQRHHHTMKTFDDNGNPGSDATLLLMPCWDGRTAIGTKIVTICPDNGKKDLPAVQGIYLLSDGLTGEPKALLDGQTLTVARTAATSALAGRYLAKENCSSMLMVGTGSLAPYLIRAHAAEKNLKDIYLWGRNREKAENLATLLNEDPFTLHIVDDLQDACDKVDIITTATLSKEPLVLGDWVKPGTHVDLVGAYTPDMRESDDTLMKKASVFVDTYEGAMTEGGDITQPLANGTITKADILADLYELCQKKSLGRKKDGEITVFKSVGNAIEDFVAAQVVVNTLKL